MVRHGKNGGKVAGSLSHLIMRGLFALERGFRPNITKMGLFSGHFDAIEEIELPEGNLIALPIESDNNAENDVLATQINQGEPIKVTPKTIPLPSIAPLPDNNSPPTPVTPNSED